MNGICWRGDAVEHLAVVPGHPAAGICGRIIGMAFQFGEVVEGVGLAEFAGVNEAHENVAHVCAMAGFIK